MKYIYFINRFSLRENTNAVITGLKTASEEFHRDYQIEVSDTPEEAVRAIRRYRDGEAVLTAVGGDGSIHHLLNGLAGTKNILSFVPFGTGNDFFRTCMEAYGSNNTGSEETDTGIPGSKQVNSGKSGSKEAEVRAAGSESDIKAAGSEGAETGASGTNEAYLEESEGCIHEIDLIRINDRYSINTICFGIDADIANDETFIHNRLIPRSMRFNAGVVYHFLTFGKGRLLKVKCGEETFTKRFTTVIAANGRYYGCGYRVSPGSSLEDGVMDVYLIDRVRKIKMARLILSMKNAGHLKDPALRLLRTGKLTISSPVPILANVDGEPLPASRFVLELVPKGARLEFDRRFIERARELIAQAK
ncbi:MAG: diacylglycerol kinase family protein [Eubacteriales bacterium]|nr:diacylglycerol kinase family protein [Eubacteriales bacterium]